MRESDLGNQISTDKPQIKRGKPYFRLFQLTYKVSLRAAAKTRSSCDRNRTISLMSQLMALDGVKIAILDGKLGSCESLFLFQKKINIQQFWDGIRSFVVCVMNRTILARG